jgi:hypothetical protein
MCCPEDFLYYNVLISPGIFFLIQIFCPGFVLYKYPAQEIILYTVCMPQYSIHCFVQMCRPRNCFVQMRRLRNCFVPMCRPRNCFVQKCCTGSVVKVRCPMKCFSEICYSNCISCFVHKNPGNCFAQFPWSVFHQFQTAYMYLHIYAFWRDRTKFELVTFPEVYLNVIYKKDFNACFAMKANNYQA